VREWFKKKGNLKITLKFLLAAFHETFVHGLSLRHLLEYDVCEHLNVIATRSHHIPVENTILYHFKN